MYDKMSFEEPSSPFTYCYNCMQEQECDYSFQITSVLKFFLGVPVPKMSLSGNFLSHLCLKIIAINTCNKIYLPILFSFIFNDNSYLYLILTQSSHL